MGMGFSDYDSFLQWFKEKYTEVAQSGPELELPPRGHKIDPDSYLARMSGKTLAPGDTLTFSPGAITISDV